MSSHNKAPNNTFVPCGPCATVCPANGPPLHWLIFNLHPLTGDGRKAQMSRTMDVCCSPFYNKHPGTQPAPPPQEHHQAKNTLAPSAPSQYPNLGKAVLHVAESGTHTDGFPTGDTEDPLDVVCHNFCALHRRVEEPVKQCRVGMGRERYQVPFHRILPISTHLLILAYSLLLAT